MPIILSKHHLLKIVNKLKAKQDADKLGLVVSVPPSDMCLVEISQVKQATYKSVLIMRNTDDATNVCLL